MKKVILIVFCLTHLGLFSQQTGEFSDYQPLVCAGDIPPAFKMDLAEWIKKIEIPSASSNPKGIQLDNEFKEQAAYSIMNRLYNGDILYGDELTQYVNKVADSALKSQPELRAKLSFYVIKSSDFNAYSTPGAVIFISMGLLARLETEAQLAYIICHEAAHYSNFHNYHRFIFRKNENQGKKGKDQKVVQRRLLEKSKADELEADMDGLEYFLASPYAKSDVESMFGIMLYSYLPFAEIPFDTTYFDSEGKFAVPHKYFPYKINSISAEEDVPDSNRTHPNVLKRRTAVKGLIEADNEQNGKSFLFGEHQYRRLIQIARYEMAQIYMAEGEYEETIYAAYLIEKLYGKSLYTDQLISASLYQMAKHKNHKTEQDRTPYNRAGSKRKINADNAYWESIEGESQAVYYFAAQLPPKEMTILAIRHSLTMWSRYRDVFFLNRAEDLLKELSSKHLMETSDFYAPPRSVLKSELPCSDSSACKRYFKSLDEADVKIEKNSERFNYSRSAYFLYAFSDLFTDSMYAIKFNKRFYILKYADEQEGNLDLDTVPVLRNANKKILMFYPDYNAYVLKYASAGFSVYTYRVNDPKITPSMELKKRIEISQIYLRYATSYGMDVTMTGIGTQKEMNTEAFNRYQQLMTWYAEKSMAGESFGYIYNDEHIRTHSDQYRYLLYAVCNSVNKGMEFAYVLFDLQTGKLELIISESEEKGGLSKLDRKIKNAIQQSASKL